MAKLYPPYIEGTIPSFYEITTGDRKGTADLVVPFSMNRAVSKSSVSGFYAKLKTVQNNNLLMTLSALSLDDYDIEDDYCVTFKLTAVQVAKLNVGQYYKIQIAYRSDSGEIGYYSTVGVVKFTTEPTVEIVDLTSKGINNHKYTYVGRYGQINYKFEQIGLIGYEAVELTAATYTSGVYYIKNSNTMILDPYTAFDSTLIYYKKSNIYKPGQYYIKSNNTYKISSTETADTSLAYYERVPILATEKDDNGNVVYEPKDSTEKEYSYQFLIYQNGEVIEDSGVLLHNSSVDTSSYESFDEWQYTSDLDEGVSYYIQYKVITNNKLEIASPKYRLMQRKSIDPEIVATITAEVNYDNGYIDVALEGTEETATGAFVICRACSDDNYKIWNEVHRFVLHNQFPSRFLWKDFTVAQGKEYKYSLQQYSDSGLYSNRLVSNAILVDFEDAFLYDGEKQLKIKYNPKITSFKEDHLETKTDTIGSKYPFIFRNGNVSYKEFPISGLISYLSDEENLFMKDSEIGLTDNFNDLTRTATFGEDVYNAGLEDFLQSVYNAQSNFTYDDWYYNFSIENGMTIEEYIKSQEEQKEKFDTGRARTTDLVDYNISAEREFKLAVLEWLNNGKPKLFRSPAEGNYFVRLMNVSLAPDDKLSRMLHTFSATAYEVADASYETLNSYGIITVGTPDNTQLRWESLPLCISGSSADNDPLDSRYYHDSESEVDKGWYLKGEVLGYSSAATFMISDMQPGDSFYLTQSGCSQQKIVIGPTGTYQLTSDSGISSVYLDQTYSYGMITYSFYDDAQNVFNQITDVDTIDVPSRQFMGMTVNISDYITNVRDNLIKYYYLHFTKRDVLQAYKLSGASQLYRDSDCSITINSVPSYLSSVQDSLDNGYFEDPFALYKYTDDEVLYTNVKEFYLCSDAYVASRDYYQFKQALVGEEDGWELADQNTYEIDKNYYYKTGKNDNYEYVLDTTVSKKSDVQAYKAGWTAHGGYYFRNTGVKAYAANKYYIYNLVKQCFVLCEDEEYSRENTYYNKVKVSMTKKKYAPDAYYYNKTFYAVRYYDPLVPSLVIYDPESLALMSDEDAAAKTAYSTEIILGYGDKWQSVDLEDTGTLCLDTPIKFDTIEIGTGIVLEAGYQLQRIHYSLEETNAKVASALLKVQNCEELMDISETDAQLAYIDALEAQGAWGSSSVSIAAISSSVQSEALNEINVAQAQLDAWEGCNSYFLGILETAKEEWEENLV